MSQTRCKPGSHYFPPFNESSDLGGGCQKCECGLVMIDRTLGGGRRVEFEIGNMGVHPLLVERGDSNPLASWKTCAATLRELVRP